MLSEGDKRTPHQTRYPQASSIEFRRELTGRDKRYLKRAVALARKRDVDYNNHCAIAVRGSKLLAIGFNAYKNEPSALSEEHMRAIPGRNGRMGVGTHAETSALNQLMDPSGVTVYVVRILKDGTVANSRPCEGCVAHLHDAGVKRVMWSEDGMNLD